MPEPDTDLEALLAAHMAGEPIDGDWPELRPPEDANRADAMLRALQWTVAEQGRIERFVKAERAKLDAWAADLTAGLARRQQQLEKVLEAWTRANHRLQPKQKSWPLPHGTPKLAAPRYTVVVVDEDAALAWLDANMPALVRTKREVAANEVHAKLQPGPVVAAHEDVNWHAAMAADEVVPGLRFALATADRFSIGPARAAKPPEPDPTEPPPAEPVPTPADA